MEVPIDRNPHTVTLPYQLTENVVDAIVQSMLDDKVPADEIDRRVGWLYHVWKMIRRGPDFYK